uniref:L,D-transpeptidase family protein n=1 Tax=Thaumasiovibrio occultus TaxID=1891184 RepID=UPI000B35BDE1|nr:L,D-transpeptidase family protein [Thaumasiovibrio occultus]
MPLFAAVDQVVINKSAREMHLVIGGEIIRTYRIALGRTPQGHKILEGDSRTPEGVYELDYVLENSSYYRAMHVSYPNAADIAAAEKLGVSPGGQIMIHGQTNGSPYRGLQARDGDWTNGCIAISNAEMDEFLSLVDVGTPILIEW